MTKGKTGPATDTGKAVIARNALTHGITSTKPVIPGMERESDWRRYRDGILASLGPESDLEHALAERVALLLWRLHRVTRFEVAVTAQQVEDEAEDLAHAAAYIEETGSEDRFPDLEPVDRAQDSSIIPEPHVLDNIIRYETHLHRQCLQTLHELEALQARRRGEPSPLARLDISAPPLT